jgi:hypothetical protein
LIRKKLWKIKREILLKTGVHPPGMEPPEPPEEETEFEGHNIGPVTASNPL